jgi:thiol:disulfide interchange protein DsbD
MGGIIGVFFMAITLALVSFSCTGPILGSFLAGTLATNPDPYNILFVMLGFGTALGLPFALFAAFPAWLNSLPKSGGWLNSVKVVLGFLELGMALKFISNADLVEQWGLLKRELFLGIWAVLAFALAAYL